MSDQHDGGTLPPGSPPPNPSDRPAGGAESHAWQQPPEPRLPHPVDPPAAPPHEIPSQTPVEGSVDSGAPSSFSEPVEVPASGVPSAAPSPDAAVAAEPAPPIGEIFAAESKPEKKKGSFLRELPLLILIAFGLALLIKSFLIQAFYIPSESMVPTLNVGDRVLVNKVVYKIREPRRGEIVVFVGERLNTGKRNFWQRLRDTLTSGLGGNEGPDRDFIKRVIGLPGDTIQIDAGRVTITPKNGEAFTLDEPYLSQNRDLQPYGPSTVPANSYFVMGDNRGNSSDSRGALGPVKKKEIIGRAFVRLWPVNRFHSLRAPTYEMGIALPLLAWGALRRRRRPAAA